MQRIEDYKESVSREELMRLANDAATELRNGSNGQLEMSEILMEEMVDQLIIGRLKLPSFKKWRSRILPLRQAQRSPTRWGISPSDPVGTVLPILEPADRALIIGAGAEAAAYLLAAHDLELQCLLGDSAAATRIEGKMASESLSGRFEAFVVMLGRWWPPEVTGPFHLVVVDAAAVMALEPEPQRALLLHAQQRTAPEGLHAVVSSSAESAPEGCLHHYQNWRKLPLGAGGSGRTDDQSLRGVLLSGPPIRSTGLYSRP